ncbi:SLC13 family permease [Hutsoniella sourekii]|uniref:SLC13 family permease n=1 Tax=Hutsoniella sourekii TaxID=87650 RepID=UPI0004B22644|nr:SLC13 family permease [Hutsoniella sourekii]
MIKRLFQFIYQDKVFLIALLLALASVFLGEFQLAFINWQVILSLFGMMLVLALFSASGLLQHVSIRIIHWSHHTRQMALWMVNLAFFFSMILSNDVAVLTLLPLYLMMVAEIGNFRGKVAGSVLITVAANLGGIIFPFSNPQNLIIYIQNNMTSQDFLKMSLPMTLFSFFILILITWLLVEDKPIVHDLELNPLHQQKLLVASFSFIVMASAILGFMPILKAVIIVSLICLFYLPASYQKIDYRLLITFACFFIIVGNVSHLSVLNEFLTKGLNHSSQTFLTSLGLSQIFSNVPTTILLEPYTQHIEALWYGVNIGGLGSLVGSLANLIGYQIIKAYHPASLGAYLKSFLVINFSVLAILSAFYYLITSM